MTIVLSRRAIESLAKAGPSVCKAFHKQLAFLESNLLHSSLHAKKYDTSSDLWQARVNRDWRFYFFLRGNTCYITRIIPHPK